MPDTQNTPQTETSEASLLQLEMVGQIVAAYLSNTQVAVADIPGLIQNISQSVHGLSQFGGASAQVDSAPQEPKVSIKKSITPDYLISLESGRRLKSLKRYLRTNYGLSPDEYRAKWGLAKDYPMVAPNYAKARSDLAKSMGLGTGGPGRPPKTTTATATTKATPAAKKAKRTAQTSQDANLTGTKDEKTAATA